MFITYHKRLFCLVISILLGICCIFFTPAAILFFWIAAAIIFYSLKYPNDELALQQDQRDHEQIEAFESFHKQLEALQVIDYRSTEENFKIKQKDQYTFILEITQASKTQDDIKRCCENALNILNVSEFDLLKFAPSIYFVQFHKIPAAEAAARKIVNFADLEQAKTIEKISVGKYANDEPVYINLESRNYLINGNPRAGKSVFLSVLISQLCKIPNEKIIVLSPKILDFQNFQNVALLSADPEDILSILEQLKDQLEKRKQFCIDHQIKKIEPKHYQQIPHITVIVDEFTVLKNATATDDKGKIIKIGEQIENLIMRMVAEFGFSACTFVLSTQRASSKNMSTDLRDLIVNKIGFASEGIETDKMIFGDVADIARSRDITTEQKGVGYAYLDGKTPAIFKCAYADPADEKNAADIKRKEAKNATANKKRKKKVKAKRGNCEKVNQR